MLDLMQSAASDEYLTYLDQILESVDPTVAWPFIAEAGEFIEQAQDGGELWVGAAILAHHVRDPVPAYILAILRTVMASPSERFPGLSNEAASFQSLPHPVAWSLSSGVACPDSDTIYYIKYYSAGVVVRNTVTLSDAQQDLQIVRSRDHAWVRSTIMLQAIWNQVDPPACWTAADSAARNAWVRAAAADLAVMDPTDVEALLPASVMQFWLSWLKQTCPEIFPAVAELMVAALSRLGDAQLISNEARAPIASYIRQQSPLVVFPIEW